MKIKRFGVALLACVMCFGAFSTTAFAYVDENAAKEEPVAEEKNAYGKDEYSQEDKKNGK